MTLAALRFLLIVVLCLISGITLSLEPNNAASRIQAQEPEKAQLERRFESVGTLIERSSAARQIEANGDNAARDRQNNARRIYRQAQEAYQAGDLEKASQLLSEASVVMFEAVRTADPEKVTAQKTQTDFNNKVESVKALLAAQKRISQEKPDIKGTEESTRQIEIQLADAQRLATANQMNNARAALDRAYLMAKASISSMRSGDTLVRSLNFTSKEEEYRYELDRNDTHQLLIKLLLEEKRGAPTMDSMVRSFLENAGRMRGQAEANASRGDYGAAIKLLENSTAELVKAIRNAGIFIPG